MKTMRTRPVVAIDGPAGAGKSSVTKAVAYALRYTQVDTGALYRAVAYSCKLAQVDSEDKLAIGRLAQDLARRGRLNLSTRLDADGETAPLSDSSGVISTAAISAQVTQISLDGENISKLIRTQEMGLAASAVSQVPAVRDALLQIQRQLGQGGGVVLEGRDIGSIVFPDAEAKFFLTASIEVRSLRRQLELAAKGENLSLDRIQEEVAERDRRDMNRTIAPLIQAADAQVVDSSELTLNEVVGRIVSSVQTIERELSESAK
jgi:cytidylate kinase